MIKVDLITGFLGSGKTTFIKKYVRYLLDKGEKVGIIENDYGAINVDMLLLSKEFGDECGMEMVVAADPDCHRRRFKTKLIAMGMDGVNEGKYDRIIVEPSGIYDVDEFFDILYEEPLDRFYEIGNVIAIVDAGLSDELSKESDYLLVSQIAEAGMVVFSKVEGGDVENVIVHMNRALEKFKCGRRYELCKIDNIDREGECKGNKKNVSDNKSSEESGVKASGLIGNMKKEKHITEDVMIKSWDNLTANDFERIENCGYIPEDHIKLHVAEDNGYRSLFYFHVKLSENELVSMVDGLFADESYGNIYRIKGFVPEENAIIYNDNSEGAVDITHDGEQECRAGNQVGDIIEKQNDMYIEINATRQNIEITHTDKGQEVIIVIGEGLDNVRIEEYIRSCSHEKDITAGQSNHSHVHS